MTIYFHDNSTISTASALGRNTGDILQTTAISRLTSNYSTTSGTYQDTGLSASITPSATSSKIIIIACLDCSGWGDRDRRPNTCICYGSVSNSNKLAQQLSGEYHTGDGGSYSYGGNTYWYLHSPSTTSQVTYRVGLASLDGSNVRVIGDSGVDTRSYMFLQEVKG
tara:strand:- start:456 stop:953 length:498 start_codon:yes stop_codon:yes gene_type:complete